MMQFETFYKCPKRKKNSYNGKKCRNGVVAFKKVAEHCCGVFRLNVSTDNT